MAGSRTTCRPRAHAANTAQSPADFHKQIRDWQLKLYEGGYAGIAWPKEFGGRGATFIEQAIFQEEMAVADTPETATIGQSLVGPTIIAVGTEAQKKRFLPGILSGEEVWCQGFSEPNAGSDLASLETKAVLDGDHFVINGQKIWTSFAHFADLCLLVVRTGHRAAAKHKGITCLLVDMKSPGITVRPLKMMSGDAEFNEMFFSNLRVPVDRVLGKVNEGWHVAITALSNERANLGIGLYVAFKRNLDSVVEQARSLRRHGKPVLSDPVLRQKLAQAYVDSGASVSPEYDPGP